MAHSSVTYKITKQNSFLNFRIEFGEIQVHVMNYDGMSVSTIFETIYFQNICSFNRGEAFRYINPLLPVNYRWNNLVLMTLLNFDIFDTLLVHFIINSSHHLFDWIFRKFSSISTFVIHNCYNKLKHFIH